MEMLNTHLNQASDRKCANAGQEKRHHSPVRKSGEPVKKERKRSWKSIADTQDKTGMP